MTYRGYPDRVGVSTSGSLRLEASSPQNATGHLGRGLGFQRDFHYRLMDVRTGRVVWERLQEGQREPSPVELIVCEDGRAVVRAHYGEWDTEWLLVLDAAGRKRLEVLVTSAVGREDRPRGSVPMTFWRDAHVGGGSAGPHWDGGSLPYFASVRDGLFFCWRTWWARRLIIDMDGVRLLDDAEAETLAPRLLDRERTVAMEALRRHTESVVRGSAEWGERRQVLGALLAAGAGRIREAVPYARSVEGTSGTHRERSCVALGTGWVHRFNTGRAIARRALRLLGEEPAPGGNIAFRYRLRLLEPELAEEHGLVVAPGDREAYRAALSIEPGTSAAEVLSRLGPPDWIGCPPHDQNERGRLREAWEYDGPASTTRLTWSDAKGRTCAELDAARVVESTESLDSEACFEWRLRDWLFL